MCCLITRSKTLPIYRYIGKKKLQCLISTYLIDFVICGVFEEHFFEVFEGPHVVVILWADIGTKTIE